MKTLISSNSRPLRRALCTLLVGIAAILAIPGNALVFLTAPEDADFAQAASDAGGLGYVVKARLASDLLPAIRAALADRRFISPTLRLDEARLTSPDPSDKPTPGRQ